MNVGGAIKMFRTAANVGQKELAEKAGISVSYISQIERGSKDPKLSTFITIADALQVSPILIIYMSCGEKQIQEIDYDVATALSRWTIETLSRAKS